MWNDMKWHVKIQLVWTLNYMLVSLSAEVCIPLSGLQVLIEPSTGPTLYFWTSYGTCYCYIHAWVYSYWSYYIDLYEPTYKIIGWLHWASISHSLKYYMQNDHVVAPIFSVPHKSIEDNQFTSLLLFSLISFGYTTANGLNPTIQWCDNLVIEVINQLLCRQFYLNFNIEL